MDCHDSFSIIQVVYQLSWDGKLEHPHMIEVQYPSDQDGLRLKDVKKRLTTLRGKGMPDSFSWSYKRNYKSTFIWNDLSDEDVIHPLRGTGEYVLKASELIDTFATAKADEHKNEYQTERRHSSFTPSQIGDGSPRDIPTPRLPTQTRSDLFDDCSKLTLERSVSTKDGLRSAVHTADVRRYQHDADISCNAVSMSDATREDENAEGVSRGIKEKPSTISVDQETIDLEKPDFCLSSSDGEISPRQETIVKEVKEAMAVRTRSATVQGYETPPPSFPSPVEPLHSPGGTQRVWKREIRKSLFRGKHNNNSPISRVQEESIFLEGSEVSRPQQDVSFLSDARSKSFCTSGANVPREQTEERFEQPTSHLHVIKMLWARWTGGSKSKRIAVKTCEPTSTRSSDDTKNAEKDVTDTSVLSLFLSEAPCNERDSSTEQSLQSTCETIVEGKTCDLVDKEADAAKEEVVNYSRQQAPSFIEESVPARTEDVCSATTRTDLKKPADASLQPCVELLTVIQEPSVPSPEVMSRCLPSEAQAQPLATESFPRPAIARVLVEAAENLHSAAQGKTNTSGRPVPPGFHKGTNDTKPQTPRKSIRNPIFVSSPPLMRSLSKTGWGSTSGRSTFGGSSERSPVAMVSWRKGPLDTKCTNFRERDERPLIPGLTNLDWEKALQEAVSDCLPPPDFRHILKECSNCGRTFKPDSLKVHMRGCHSPRNLKTRPSRLLATSPHMLRTRAP